MGCSLHTLLAVMQRQDRACEEGFADRLLGRRLLSCLQAFQQGQDYSGRGERIPDAGAAALVCAASLLPSSAATFSQSLRDRQYTIPHCGRPCVQNWRQMRSSISAMASSNLVFFFTTSYLPCIMHTSGA